MPWYVPVVLVPSLLSSAYFIVKAFNEIEKGADHFSVLALGIWASDERFTPRGRRYRMWSLALSGGGVLLVILIYLVSSIK